MLLRPLKVKTKIVDTYSSLRKKYKESGMQVYDIIEKRLIKGSSWKVSSLLVKTFKGRHPIMWWKKNDTNYKRYTAIGNKPKIFSKFFHI